MTLKWLRVPGMVRAFRGDERTLLRARSDVTRPDGTHCCYEILIDAPGRGAASLSGDLVEEVSIYENVDGAKAQAQRLEDENTVVVTAAAGPGSEPVTLCSCAIERVERPNFRGFVSTVNTTAWSRSHRTAGLEPDDLRLAGAAIAYLLGFLASGETPPVNFARPELAPTS